MRIGRETVLVLPTVLLRWRVVLVARWVCAAGAGSDVLFAWRQRAVRHEELEDGLRGRRRAVVGAGMYFATHDGIRRLESSETGTRVVRES